MRTNIIKKQGFTLLELLVALSIFSMISVMAYGGLQTVITTKNSTQQASTRIAEVQLAMLRIANDLRQAVARNIRDEHGDTLAAMTSGTSSGEQLEWSRAGYRNPAHLKRSNIQRVAYKIEQDKLMRLTWPVLDRAQDSEVMKTEILSRLESVEWRFFNSDNIWVSEWPEQSNAVVAFSLPQAVEINVVLKDFGSIQRLILLANKI